MGRRDRDDRCSWCSSWPPAGCLREVLDDQDISSLQRPRQRGRHLLLRPDGTRGRARDRRRRRLQRLHRADGRRAGPRRDPGVPVHLAGRPGGPGGQLVHRPARCLAGHHPRHRPGRAGRRSRSSSGRTTSPRTLPACTRSGSSASETGLYWGALAGLLVGLVGMLAFAASRRSAAEPPDLYVASAAPGTGPGPGRHLVVPAAADSAEPADPASGAPPETVIAPNPPPDYSR